MAKWLDKYEQGGMVLKKKTKDNYDLKFNPNDVKASVGPGFVGLGYDTTGRNYSPAWGGQFAMGGSLPGAVGFTYARVAGSAPANGKYTKKTKASAQNGKDIQKERYNELYAPIENKVFDAIGTQDSYDKLPYSTKDFLNKTIAGFSVASNRNIPPMDPIIKEVQNKVQELPKEELTKLLNTNWSKIGLAGAMKNTPSSVSYLDMLKYINHFNKLKKKGHTLQNGGEMEFYQNGLDWKPNNISKDGSVIKDDRGQWAHPGEITEIGSNEITMQGVDYPVLGVSDTGDTKMMQPGEDYKFDGDKVTEYPMMQGGGWLDKYPEPMRQDATRVAAPIRPLTKKEQEENARINKETQKRTKERDEKIIAERAAKRKTKGDVNVPGSFNIAEKARLFPESVGGVGEMFDDYLNPATYVGVLADALGESIAARDPKAIATSLALAAGTGALGIDPLGSALKVPGKVAQSMESGLLSNAYKLNPYAFKPTEGMMYRGLGKEGMEDAVQSGLFRAKQNVTPTSIGNFNTTRQFSKAYYSPRFDIADQYGQGFIAEVPRAASDWGKRYGKKEWSQIAQRDIPTTEGKILKKDWLKGYKEVSKNKSTKVSEIDWAKWNPEIPKNKKLMEEYINIENSTKANDVWMKNPDGSEFKGTPEQFVQQQSQNFKKAFGNSKLVNPDGSPIMLYHGAPERFNVFDPALFQRGDAGYSGVGIYTTPSKTVADSYAYSSRSFIGGKEHTPTVYELYGQANNPISSEQLVNEGGKRDLFNFNRTANWKGEIPIEERLTGYDAAIANKHPNVTNVRPWNDAYEIVFPTNKQLKSAVGNNGMFDMNNPNIYKALLPAVGVAGIERASQKKNGGWLSKYK